MDVNVSLTPSYMYTLVKYQKAVEPRVLERSTIKSREMRNARWWRQKNLQEVRHVQKNGVIYKRRAQQQILERTVDEQEYRDGILNAKIIATNKEYKEFLRGLEKKVKREMETDCDLCKLDNLHRVFSCLEIIHELSE
jgi:hypothetical protein